MILNFKYRLKPNKTQKSILDHNFFLKNQAYNQTLDIRKNELKNNKSGFSLVKEIEQKIKENLKERNLNYNSGLIQMSVRHAEFELKQFYKKKKEKGFPKFRNSKSISQSFEFKNQGIQITESYFRILKMNIKWSYHRELPNFPKTVRIKRESDGNYFVIFAVEIDKIQLPKSNMDCAIDLNINNVAIAESTGDSYLKTIRKLVKYDKKYLKIQKKLSKRYESKNFSKNTKKLQQKLNKTYNKARNIKEDFFHKFSHELVKKFDRITAEDLEIKKMKEGKIRRLRIQISEVSWGSLIQKLQYKSIKFNKLFEQINPAYTSQRCNCCGYISRKNRTTQAKFLCKECGFSANADENAARNILDYSAWSNIQKQLLEEKAVVDLSA